MLHAALGQGRKPAAKAIAALEQGRKATLLLRAAILLWALAKISNVAWCGVVLVYKGVYRGVQNTQFRPPK